MTAVAVTDHGNLHGAVEFYTAARSKGVKPVFEFSKVPKYDQSFPMTPVNCD